MIVITVLVLVFILQEGDTIQENFENRPQLVVVTPGPPPHQWTEVQALEFFREYAIVRPAPETGTSGTNLETCWDYALSITGGDPTPFKIGSSGQSAAVPIASRIPIWGLEGNGKLWRFWENTRSVVGPC